MSWTCPILEAWVALENLAFQSLAFSGLACNGISLRTVGPCGPLHGGLAAQPGQHLRLASSKDGISLCTVGPCGPLRGGLVAQPGQHLRQHLGQHLD